MGNICREYVREMTNRPTTMRRILILTISPQLRYPDPKVPIVIKRGAIHS